MSVIEASPPTSARARGHVYVRPPKPIFFPSSVPLEERVPESKRHLTLRTTLYLLLDDAFAATAAIGSDQFVYWDPEDPRKCLSPDAFVKLGLPDDPFDNWKVWERGAPDVAIEIVSRSDRPESDWMEKLSRYRASGIRELVRFDALKHEQPIRIWDQIDGDLVERASHDPGLRECTALGLWWVLVPSSTGPMLRLARDREGREVLPTPGEDRLRLAEELADERKARALAEHDRLVAERERAIAEKERKNAESERVTAESERDAALAEVARLRAELARAGSR